MRLSKSTAVNGSLILIAALGGWFAYDEVGLPSAATATAAQRTAVIGSGTVMSTISTSGNVTAPNNINVNFATSGKIAQIAVTVGQKVKKGDVLGKLDSTAAQASVDSAKAQLASAQANLQELQQGATSLEKQSYALSNKQAAEQVTQAQAQLDSTQQQLSFDQTNFAAAVTKAQEQLSTDQASASEALANDQSALEQAENQQVLQLQADNAQLNADQATYTACASGDPANVTTCENNANVKISQDKLKIQQDSQNTTSAQQKLATDTLTWQQKLDSDQDNITSAQTSQTQGLAKDQQSIKSAQQSISNAQLQEQVTLNNNAQKTAAPQQSQIETDEAQVEQADASVASNEQALDATVLTAPADGTIGAINDTVGQTVSAGTTGASSSGASTGSGSSSTSSAFITLTNLTSLQVVANIDEADSSKVSVGSPATVTLNAITGKEFAAHVIAVADSATVSSNVVQYEVTFQLDNTDPTIKPGMTANVSVTTAKADGVLNVTSSAVRTSGGSSYVMVVQPDGTEKQVDVVVGLKGDTTTEITGAVKAGDTVSLPTSTVSRSTSTSSTTNTRTGGGLLGGGGGFTGGGFTGGGGFGGRG
jgi:multidrug efflux pump subunit AcrA (membrane-fusion protein)